MNNKIIMKNELTFRGWFSFLLNKFGQRQKTVCIVILLSVKISFDLIVFDVISFNELNGRNDD